MLQIFFIRLISWSCFSLLSLISISGKSWTFPSGLWFIFNWFGRDFGCAGVWSGRCSCLHKVVLTGRDVSAGVNILQSKAELSQPPCQGTFTRLCLQHAVHVVTLALFSFGPPRHLRCKFRIKSPVSFNIRQPDSNLAGINPQN